MKKSYHFIGIGGIGMGALAFLLIEKGFAVSGSDLNANVMTSRLQERGVKIFRNHCHKNIEGADIVVYSSAIKGDNPELESARDSGKKILRRAQLLAQLMEDQTGITVAGAHGKTTTSSMIASLLTKTHFFPTVAVGGIPVETLSNANLGEGKYFVAEVDESDGTFLYFAPKYSVITNIDYEHMDHYATFDELLECYQTFISQTQEGGVVIACGDDAHLTKLLANSDVARITYGESKTNDFWLDDYRSDGVSGSFTCYQGKQELGRVFLNVPGKHNALNALSCIIVGLEMGIEFSQITEELKNFRGVQRRFQLLGDVNGIRIIDDYAHHPVEIECVLSTVKSLSPDNLIVVFQPHRYTRLQALKKDFIHVLKKCSHLVVTDVYAASEDPIEGVSAEALVTELRKMSQGRKDYVAKEDLVCYLKNNSKPGDVVLMLGAGDITSVSKSFLDVLKTEMAGSSC